MVLRASFDLRLSLSSPRRRPGSRRVSGEFLRRVLDGGNRHSAIGNRGSAGFALIEVLVSLALLAMILALLPGALRAGNRALNDALALSRPSSSGLTLRYVAQRLEEALPHYDHRGGRASKVAFLGLKDRVSFLSPMASGPLGGGIYRLDLGVRRGAASGPAALVLGMALDGDPGAEAQDAGTERVLMGAIRDVRFRYFGSRTFDDARGWHDDWIDADRLPELVEVSWARARDARAASALRVALRLR